MTPLRRATLICGLVLVGGSITSTGHAWNIKDECGLKGTRMVRYLECSPSGFPGFPAGTSDFSSPDGEPEAKAAMLDAYWMWDRDIFANTWLWVDQSNCYSGGEDGGWMNPSCSATCLIESDDKTESWWEAQSIVEDKCGSGNVGCEHSIRQWLGCGGINGFEIDETDVMLAIDLAGPDTWQEIDQNTVGECLDDDFAVEQMWLHEIGHSYGLGHDNSLPLSLMNANVGVETNCHTAQGFSAYPFADEFFGKTKANGSMSSTDFQVAGTAWFNSGGSAEITDMDFPVAGGWDSVTVQGSVSVQSMYKEPADISIRFYLVAVGDTPVFNWSDHSWSIPYEYAWSESTETNVDRESRRVDFNELIAGLSLTVGTYRVWGRVDVADVLDETDEGDNVFPTAVTVTRM